MHPGRVRLPGPPAAAGDVPLQPGQAAMVHVHAQGPPRAADILADAQVMQQTEEKIQEINAIDGLFVFPLQRQVGRTGRREEGPPPWNVEMMNSSTDNFFPCM